MKRGPGFIVSFIVRAIVGMALIFFVNEFLSSKGIDARVGLNPISFLTSGILGIPGLLALYGIGIYQLL